jgi:hypothetical protein
MILQKVLIQKKNLLYFTEKLKHDCYAVVYKNIQNLLQVNITIKIAKGFDSLSIFLFYF